LNRHERRKLAAAAKGPQPTNIDKWSVWWGVDGAQLDPASIAMVDVADIAIGKLTGFDASKISEFPVFKDPANEFESGASLCRLGFPFYDVGTTFDPQKGFQLHNVPLPIFPNEGILSRMAEIILVDQSGKFIANPPFPLRMIETSSAGIRGQSGGPIFDENGVVWGIQSATTSYQMDLKTKEQQYYHVGVGVHTATILGLMKQQNIKFDVASY